MDVKILLFIKNGSRAIQAESLPKISSAQQALSFDGNIGGNVQHEKCVFRKGACPDCGGIVERENGYAVCRICGYSECA